MTSSQIIGWAFTVDLHILCYCKITAECMLPNYDSALHNVSHPNNLKVLPSEMKNRLPRKEQS